MSRRSHTLEKDAPADRTSKQKWNRHRIVMQACRRGLENLVFW
jgi:hypothetical protein